MRRMSKCLLWKKFLWWKHLDNNRLSLLVSLFISPFLSGVFTSAPKYGGFLICRAWGVCMSVGSTWFSDMPAKWAEERSWCSNIHKINFSCGCEVNFWRNIWNGSQLICVTDLAHPYNLDEPEKIPSHTHMHISYATSSHTLIFSHKKNYWAKLLDVCFYLLILSHTYFTMNKIF